MCLKKILVTITCNVWHIKDAASLEYKKKQKKQLR